MRKRIISLLIFTVLVFSNVFALRIVSLSPIDSKSLILLGAEDMVVGCTQWCPFAAEKPNVANCIEVNIEEVLKLKPDVIMVSTLTSKESIATMKRLGLKVFESPRVASFDVMCQEFIKVGELIGKKELAEKEVAKAKARLKMLSRNIPDSAATPKVMLQVSDQPIFVAIPNTFLDDYIKLAGATNIYGDLEHGTVTRESVIRRNPDAIFVSGPLEYGKPIIENWMAYKELAAAQNKKVVMIDQEKASSPTIHTFIDVVEIMINTLY